MSPWEDATHFPRENFPRVFLSEAADRLGKTRSTCEGSINWFIAKSQGTGIFSNGLMVCTLFFTPPPGSSSPSSTAAVLTNLPLSIYI